MKYARRLVQYVLGIAVMALGVVLIKKAEIGISPLSAIPAAVSNITSYSLGNTTIAFHVACVAAQMLLMRKVTVKTVLILPLAVAMGYIIDGYMALLAFGEMPLWLRCALCAAGIVLTALGIVAIVGSDWMLPAPDALLRQISVQTGRPLSTVKMIGDIAWVAITFALEMIFLHRNISAGVGTLAAALLTGRLVGVFTKALPFLKLEQTSNGSSAKGGEADGAASGGRDDPSDREQTV